MLTSNVNRAGALSAQAGSGSVVSCSVEYGDDADICKDMQRMKRSAHYPVIADTQDDAEHLM